MQITQLSTALLAAGLVAVSGCDGLPGSKAAGAGQETVKLTSEYQAVHLDNGQVLFGKLEQAGSEYPVLRNVFTIQSRVDPVTKQVSQALVRRSVELHNPDAAILNARHIVAIEPVAATSRVAQVIGQAASQPAGPTQ